VDLALSVPRLFAALLLVTLFEPGLSTTIVVLGATSWMVAARLVRGEFLSLRERDFVHAARATGVSWLRMALRHVLPSAAGPVLVEAALRVGDTILLEAALSFLGLGVQPPAPSWGNMVADGRGLLESAWWISTLPGLVIGLTVLALNLLADAARERLSAGRASPEDRLVRAPARTYIPPPVRGAAAVHPLSRVGRP
jgi:peptide/nickel transport system permease protein